MSFGGTDNFIGVVKFVGQILFYLKAQLLDYRTNSGLKLIYSGRVYFFYIYACTTIFFR
jgi:hypothetical protein